MYDINEFGGRLKELRRQRYEQYKEYKKSVAENDITKQNKYKTYKKYVYCKTQESFSNKIQVERRSVGAWEKGKLLPTIENIVKICEALDCSIDYLLGSGDVPDVEPIAKICHYSRISPEIIKLCLQDDEYLDFLNFFMLPENCGTIFNGVNLSTWKTYWVNSTLEEIESPFKEFLIEIFNEYNAITPFKEVSKDSFKTFLMFKLPKENVKLYSQKTKTGVIFKGCNIPIVKGNSNANQEYNYEVFIDDLVEITFEPLLSRVYVEIQKAKLADMFISLFTKYVEGTDE
ncbi:MAG: helix-turn-helix transcriptional regulator [Ruminococcaceae bacterium]|nr:helix-turn-helix transcriptional regulator [Oscillospiraceae bacterium]